MVLYIILNQNASQIDLDENISVEFPQKVSAIKNENINGFSCDTQGGHLLALMFKDVKLKIDNINDLKQNYKEASNGFYKNYDGTLISDSTFEQDGLIFHMTKFKTTDSLLVINKALILKSTFYSFEAIGPINNPDFEKTLELFFSSIRFKNNFNMEKHQFVKAMTFPEAIGRVAGFLTIVGIIFFFVIRARNSRKE